MVAEQRDEAAAFAVAAEARPTTANHLPSQPPQQQQMRRRLLLLLNKLTPTTFELHVSRFLSFVNTTTIDDQLLHETVQTIVRRASEDGPRYVNMYAQLCRRLSLEWTVAPTQRSFHSVLVHTCRQELIRDGGFATNNDVEEEHSALSVLSYVDVLDHGRNAEQTEEEEYEHSIAKKLYIEHLRFCGELYMLGVLSIEEITGFIESMSRMAGLSSRSTSPTSSIQNIRLESYCVLLETIGWKLELPPLSSNLERMECWTSLVELIRVGNTQDDQELRFLSTRLRFMVVDLLELRSKGWRRVGPLQQRKKLVAKALSQIRVEAEADLGQTSGKKKKKKVHFGGGKK
mmetsp:Transcript_26515/g.57477  ORF Transcript_26515/g.57477 Transcript_26515/m.57477 type:complete len:345 (+) Transcript_26515:101-1135(+)